MRQIYISGRHHGPSTGRPLLCNKAGTRAARHGDSTAHRDRYQPDATDAASLHAPRRRGLQVHVFAAASTVRCTMIRRTSTRHERAFPRAAAMYRYAGWAAGRVCGRGARLAEWPGRLSTGNGRGHSRFGLGLGTFAAWHVIARSVSTLAGQADTASGRVAGQGGCLAGSDGGSVMTARAFSGQCRTRQHPLRARAGIPAPVTVVWLLDGARSVLGYQTRYAAVGCHHGLHFLQPTR